MELETTRLHLALTDLEVGQTGSVGHISLPPADQQLLMRSGVVPGAEARLLAWPIPLGVQLRADAHNDCAEGKREMTSAQVTVYEKPT
jgi:hypothetical protein